MKELLQRQAQEKLQRKLQEQKLVQATSLAAVATTATGTGTGNSVNSVTTTSQPSPAVGMVGPASANVGQPLNQHSKLNNVTVNVSPNTSSVPTSSSSSSTTGQAPSPASIPLPISTTSLTAHLREQLAKFSPQQRVQYMQQLTAHSKQTKQQQQQQQQRLVAGVLSAAQQTASTNKTTGNNILTTSANAPTPIAMKITTQPHTGIKVQQMSSGEHQVSVGGVAVKQLSPSQLPISSSNNHLAVNSGRTVMAASLSSSRGGQIRAGFVDVKLASSVSKLASPPLSSLGKGKGKLKSESGKNAADE